MLKKVFIYVFSALFLFSSAGISLQLHTCLSAGKTTYSFYPEYFGTAKSCCCSETAVNADAGSSGTPKFREIPCCSSDHILYKVPSCQYQRTTAEFSTPLLFLPAGIEVLTSAGEPSETKPVTDYRPPPILLSGVSFIRYTHSFKIPLPLS